MSAAKLILLIPYFGIWPEWINLFIESCRWNPDVHWRFYTDCGEPDNKAANVNYSHLSFGDYKKFVSNQLDIDFCTSDPYKLCDLKPCLGAIHARDIEGYPFFGFGDIDVIYGNIRTFYTDELLAFHDVISTHTHMLSGHLAIFRNTERLRNIFEQIPDYRRLLENPIHTGIDENKFTNALRRESHDKLLFVERYSTILSPLKRWHDGTMNYPHRWFWYKGRLTNDRDQDSREFLYLHFMRWRSTRYRFAAAVEGEGAWLHLSRLINIDWQKTSTDGFSISREGFHPLGKLCVGL
jgi:hypothetical protein